MVFILKIHFHKTDLITLKDNRLEKVDVKTVNPPMWTIKIHDVFQSRKLRSVGDRQML